MPLTLWNSIKFIPHEGQFSDLQIIQRALAHEPEAPRFIDATCGRQYGKTIEAAVTVMMGAFAAPDEFGPPVAKVVADSYEHTNLVFDKVVGYLYGNEWLRGLIDTSKPGKGFDRERWIIYLKNGATIQKLSADNPQSLAGHTISLAVIDEKAFVRDEAIEHLLPCLAIRKGVIVAFGTAEGTGWGRTWHFRGLDDDFPEHYSITHPSTDNPYMPLEEFEMARRSLPEKRFRQLWLAEWVTDAGSVFSNIENCAIGLWPEVWEPQEEGRYVMGVDLARYSDYTALIVVDVDTKRCMYRARFNLQEWKAQANRIAGVAKRYNNARVWVDATHGSAGDVLVDILKKEYGLDIWPYELTPGKKQQLIDKLVWALEREEIRFPDAWDDVKNELILYESKVMPSGRTTFSAPGGFHDDLVIALGLANWGAQRVKREAIVVPRRKASWEYL